MDESHQGGDDWPDLPGDMAARVRRRDWAATPLGPIGGWPDRLRAVVELVLASPLVASVALLEDRLLIYNDAAAHLYGDQHPGALGRPLRDEFPDSYPAVASLYDRAFAGEPVSVRAQPLAIGGPNGGKVFDAWLTPVRDAAGTVMGVYMVGVEVGERLSADTALRESEERLRLALSTGQLATWDWHILTDEIEWSDEHFRLEGYEIGEIQPSYEAWISRVHPDDRAQAQAALLGARDRREPYIHEFRSLHPDGTVLWLFARGGFFYDAEGTPVRMIGVMQDVTERRAWQERQQVLVAELQHRTRNLMGVIRALAERTLATSGDLRDFRSRFGDRLDALARVQGLLSRLHDHDRVTFDELVKAELAVVDGSAARVILDGPAGVRLRSASVQTLAMALHELATNAMKYGALRQPGAGLTLRWWLEPPDPRGRPLLSIDWRERGVAMPPSDTVPQGTGQGRELIEEALPYQLDARVRYVFEPDGVHCTITLPVSASNLDRNGGSG